ncbi:MAG TPA: hypothetical protein VGG34_05465 [Opitutaceae bacterium]|jgi:hypothetical protein
MIRRLSGAALIAAVLAPALRAAPVTRAEALAAVAAFERDSPANLAPAAPGAREGAAGAARILTRFCLESDAVVVDLGPDSVPWCGRSGGTPDVSQGGERGLLLAAYLCGCVKAQLAAGAPDPDPCPGWVRMLAAYRSLRVQGAARIPEVDRLLALEDSGGLKAAAARALARSMKALRRAYGEPAAGRAPLVASSRPDR